MNAREERLLTVHTLLSLLKANTYLLQRHFKKVHTRNCSFIYKKVKMKGGLGWMEKKEGNDLAGFLI